VTFVGIDDTDSPRGGCTTFALTEVIRAARARGFDLIGEPRLVRLNPNIPQKTRGNAALAARFGHGQGPRRVIGEFPEGALHAWARARALSPGERDELLEVAWEAVRRTSRRGEPGTDPAVVVSPHRLPAHLYWDAVQRVVERGSTEAFLRSHGVAFRSEGSGQGIVGAAAAIAWPGLHPTWELIAYRRPGLGRSPRRVDRASVARAERVFPELFLCSDPATRRLLIAPHTACPILLGLRATRPERLPRAFRSLVTEACERWVVYRTNQATGDHLALRADAALGPYETGVVPGEVVGTPRTGVGGHVRFEVASNHGGKVECIAFEPTKSLPRIAAQLRPGDRVRVWGGRAEDPVFRLEGLQLIRAVPERCAGPRPNCPTCGRRMDSLGTYRGFRCRADRTRVPAEARTEVRQSRAALEGWYHPTPSARRHLHPRAPEAGRGSPTRVRWWHRRPRTDL
jgi:tRNA(Ile2)-agmatinylcytidine synthase